MRLMRFASMASPSSKSDSSLSAVGEDEDRRGVVSAVSASCASLIVDGLVVVPVSV